MLQGGIEQGRGRWAEEEGESGVVILVMWSWKASLRRGQLSKDDGLGPSFFLPSIHPVFLAVARAFAS